MTRQREATVRRVTHTADVAALVLPPISIDWGVIESTTERHPFDRLGWELIARAGQIGEHVVDSTGLDDDGNRRPLTLDEAVIGGLFVRMTKLLRGLFDASQSEESEVHQIVARCVVETAVNLRWLLLRNDPQEYKRFRADSFVTWRKWLETTGATGDSKFDGIAARMKRHIENELAAAGLAWADVPRQPGSWGRGSFRQRLADLDLEGLYLVLFATHSYYVHGSWHELRTFHLKTEDDGLHVDSTFGELGPPTSYEVTIASLHAACDYVKAMPVPAAMAMAVVSLAEPTIKACARLGAAFADYVSRGGLDPLLERHASG
jgi:hypothetical protein